MDIERYRQRLLAMERELSDRLNRMVETVREDIDGPAIEMGDKSINDEFKEEQFTKAEINWTMLKQVQDAVKRIENGTFGRCVVGGEEIDAKRLEAIPWNSYCLKHEQLLGSEPERTATL